MDDKRLERMLNDLNVYCPHREKGCEWNRELRELSRHLNQDPKAEELLVGCLFQEIWCGLCQAHTCERRLMKDHVSAQCPNRDIECEYQYAGCDVKKPQQQLECHSKEAVSLHLSLVTNFVRGNLSQRDNEIQGLKEELSQHIELKQQHTELKQKHTELKQQHTDLQGRTNRHWILVLLLLILFSGYAYLYQTHRYLLVDLNKLNISMKAANVTFSSRLESIQKQFTNSCMNVSNLNSKIQKLNSSIQQMEAKQDSKIGDVRQEFSSLLQEREVERKSREWQVQNEIQALSEALEKNVMDIRRLESAYKISIMQMYSLTALCNKVQVLNDSIQRMEMKQDATISNTFQQEFSTLAEERKANEKMREQILNEIQALSKDVEKHVVDIERLESAYKNSTKQINESLKSIEKQLVASNDEWRRAGEYNSSLIMSANESLKNLEKQLAATSDEWSHEYNSSANELQQFKNENLGQQDLVDFPANEIQQLKNESLGQQDLVDFPVLPVYLNMTGVEEHIASNSHWLSAPFYTHEEGYNMRLVVYPNGKYLGAGTHISVAIYLMSGKYDDKLDWPANVTLNVTLLNQDSEDKNPIVRVFDCSTSIYDLQILDRVWNSTMAKFGVIHSRFASHRIVFAQVHSYLKQDLLYFHVDWVRLEAKHKQSEFHFALGILTGSVVHMITQYIMNTIEAFFAAIASTSADGIIIYCGIHSCYLSDSLDLTVDSLQ
jgi:hypothetical protein